MLDLFIHFLFTFLTAFIAIRFCRAVDGWQGFRQPLVELQHIRSRMSLKTQMGFISLISEPKQKAKVVRLRSATNGVKAPWGW
jgi:hypothetical protein